MPSHSSKIDDTNLLQALEEGNLQNIVKYANRKNINMESQGGHSPLMYAVSYNDIDLVRRFLDLGADPDCSDAEGLDCFWVIGEVGCSLDVLFEITKAFLFRKYAIDIRNDDLTTALQKLVALLHKAKINSDQYDEFEKIITYFDKDLMQPKSEMVKKERLGGVPSYPSQFNGSLELKQIRDQYSSDPNLSDECKASACLVGVPSSPYRNASNGVTHTFSYADNETYHRSTKGPLAKFLSVGHVQFDSDEGADNQPTINGTGYAHHGYYKNALEAITNAYGLTCEKNQHNFSARELMRGGYRYFLSFKRRICQHVSIHANTRNIEVGFYHDYPCIMVHLPLDDKLTEGAKKAWVHFIISYFVGIINDIAEKKDLPIRLSRRASFGFLTPHIAEAGESFRIDPGIIPIQYADILVEGLQQLDESIAEFKNLQSDAAKKGNYNLNGSHFINDNDYKTKYKMKDLPNATNYIDLLWQPVEKPKGRGKGNLAMQNVIRTSAMREGISDYVEALASQAPPDKRSEIFVHALLWAASGVRYNKEKNKVETVPSAIPDKHARAKEEKIIIEDAKFWHYIQSYFATFSKWFCKSKYDSLAKKTAQQLSIKIKKHIISRDINGIYDALNLANELYYAQTLKEYEGKRDDDQYGSDSEESLEHGDVCIYAKKIIVSNGTRAITNSFNGALKYVKKTVKDRISFFPYKLYYETDEVLGSIRTLHDLIKKRNMNTGTRDADIVLIDLNPCITKGLADADIAIDQLPTPKKAKVLILDSTSASERQCNTWIQKLNQHEHIEAIIFASSGFKNEQSGADKNQYGTIRIFAKKRKVREYLYQAIKEEGFNISSGLSHAYRRTMKEVGNVPRNRNILMPAPAGHEHFLEEGQEDVRIENNRLLQKQLGECKRRMLSL